jgi:hypothetical protein
MSFDYISPRVEVVAPKYVDYTPANSVYTSFPAMMTDDRSVPSTARVSTAARAQYITNQNIATNWEYRAALTKNGADIISADFRNACLRAGYVSTTELIADNEHTRIVAAPTDLKQLYLSRQALDSRRSVASFSV